MREADIPTRAVARLPLLRQLRLLILLPIRPSTLSEVALHGSHPLVIAAAAQVIAFELALLLAGFFAGMSEPFKTMQAYLLDSLTPFKGFIPTGVLLTLVLWGTFFIPPRDTGADLCRLRAVFFAPIAWLIPLIFWFPLALCAHLASPNMDIIEGKPELMDSPVAAIILIGAGCLGPPALMVAAGVHAARAILRFSWLDSERATPCCPYCGYSLAGLDHMRCPECGRSPDAPDGQMAPAGATGEQSNA